MYSRKITTWDGACLSRSERVLSGLSRPYFRGTDVAAIQRALNEFGESLIVDGSFGPDTDAAVRRYQSANDLVANGMFGIRTRRSLGLRI